jgi:hypothetical protein
MWLTDGIRPCQDAEPGVLSSRCGKRHRLCRAARTTMDAGSTMSDDGADAGSLLDVSELTIEELAAIVDEEDLGRALDYILASGQNGVGYHGFNSRI